MKKHYFAKVFLNLLFVIWLFSTFTFFGDVTYAQRQAIENEATSEADVQDEGQNEATSEADVQDEDVRTEESTLRKAIRFLVDFSGGPVDDTDQGTTQQPNSRNNTRNIDDTTATVADNVVETILSIDCFGGRVTTSNIQCIDLIDDDILTPNAKDAIRTNVRENFSPNTGAGYFQCFGFVQSIIGMVNGDIPLSQNPFRGIIWPTEVIESNRPEIVPNQERIREFMDIYTREECRENVQPGELMVLIWGTPYVYPGNQHIAFGTFLSNDRNYFRIIEANADWRGNVRNDRTSTFLNNPSAPSYCLVQKGQLQTI